MDFTDSYIKLSEDRGEKYAVMNGSIFKEYNRLIVPFGPMNKNYSLTEQQIKGLNNNLNGIAVRWTGGFENSPGSLWYAVICNEFENIRNMKSKYRNEVNKALSNCEVKRIEAQEFSQTGYEVYLSAINNYSNQIVKTVSEEKFKKAALLNSKFDDIIHYWGVYVEGKLAGYSSNYIYGKTEASYTTIKLHPKYLKHYPMYSLLYKMNEYYLQEEKMEYVTDGFRSILHETNIQDFLIKKFNFKKAYTRLHIKFRQPYSLFIKATFPFRIITGRIDKRLKALYELENVSRYQ